MAIVGAGLAGLEVARHLYLADSSLRITLIEAGPFAGSDHTAWSSPSKPVQAEWLTPSVDPYFRTPWTSISPPHYATRSGLRRRFGGRSLYWHGVVLPMEGDTLRTHWPDAVRAYLLADNSGYAQTLADLGSLGFLTAYGSGSVVTFADALESFGIKAIPTPRAVVSDPTRSRWKAYSAAPAISELISRGDIAFVPSTIVETVARSSRGASVIGRRDGERVSHHARHVVLAAGTIENSRLVLSMLARACLTGLSDHLVLGSVVRVPRNLFPAQLRGLDPLLHVPATLARPFNTFLSIAPLDKESLLLDLWAMAPQERTTANEVRLTPTATVAVSVALSRADRALLLACRRTIDNLVRPFAPPPALPGAAVDFPIALAAVLGGASRSDYTIPLGAVDHEASTVPFGGLIDADSCLAELPDVSVLGPSTFPVVGIANPSLTTLALARRAADTITTRLG